MMLCKLSFRNLAKSIRDYLIYFITLILGVAIFYVFNALEKQTVMVQATNAQNDVIRMMNGVMSGVSIFVSFVLGFLIVYASNFLMKRRKKEFGIYLLLGMSKQKVSVIILLETVFIGIISLVVGLVVGAAASQGMSIIVAKLFEADMSRFTFVLSQKAIGKTILYFVVMYIVVLIMETLVVGRTKLVDLISAGRRPEKHVNKNRAVCVLVFIIACILLGTAYYNVTAEATELSSEMAVLIEIVKGIIGTFLIFWSLSGLLLYVSRLRKNHYYKGLNSFTANEFGSRINTTVFSGSIICLMLFMTICILSSAMSVRKSINDNLKELTKSDVNFYMMDVEDAPLIREVFDEKQVDMSMFRDVVDIVSYNLDGLTQYELLGDIADSEITDTYYRDYLKKSKLQLIKESDYNKAADLYGNPRCHLKEDEYAFYADFDTVTKLFNQSLEKGYTININGTDYKPNAKKCQDGYLVISSTHSNMGFVVVPDSADLTGAEIGWNYFLANYNAEDDEVYQTIENLMDSDEFIDLLNPKDNNRYPLINMITKDYTYKRSTGIAAMLIFIGFYLGIVFMISGAAILALKELSEAADNKEKYSILRRIGVDERTINHSILAQCGLFFGIPLLLAIIHSVFGIQVCVYMLEAIGKTGLVYSILVTAGLIVLIYGAYFLITYTCCKRIASKER